MKTPKVILKGLVSGRVKLTPELLEVLKKHHDDKARPDAIETPMAARRAPVMRHRRLIFANPLPGRWIRCSGLLLVCAALMPALVSRAAGTDSAFDQANRTFAEGNMSAAARGYQLVISDRGFSAPALFNLANAQFRDGQTGPAILNYERARWLAPNDPDIAANLELARRKAGLPTQTHSRARTVFGFFGLNIWSGIAAAALLSLAAIPLLGRLVPARRFVLNASAATAASVFLAAMLGVSSQWSGLDRAIITAPETAARVSPVTVIPPLFSLRAGESVTLKKVHGAFALVANGEGREGWVSRDAVAAIVPPNS